MPVLPLLPFLAALVLAWTCAAAAPARAQTPFATDPLLHGTLIVWVVESSSVLHKADQYAIYHQSTAGSFGRAASTYGQNAGGYGQSASSLGKASSLAGQTAGSYGQSAGTLGVAASQTGQPAGEAGQTAGSFGRTLSTLNENPAPAAMPAGSVPFEPIELTSPWKEVGDDLRRTFPDLRLTFMAVSAADLHDRLGAAEGTAGYPDALMGEPLPNRQPGASLAEATFAPLGKPRMHPQYAGREQQVVPQRDALVLLRATHPEEARAVVVWLHDGQRARREVHALPEDQQAPAAVALAAAQTVLHGGDLGGSADPAAAVFEPQLAMTFLLQPVGNDALDGLQLRTDVLGAAANDRFAVVTLRAIAASAKSFGVLHPMVILRRAPGSAWRVLQFTGDLPMDELDDAFRLLQSTTRSVPAAHLLPVLSVKPAAPLDGDTRAGTPELWWDTGEGDDLLAVEWQTRVRQDWSDSHLFLVPDRGPRLQVRLTAPFLTPGNNYRWRVLSVGNGGLTSFSAWRRLTVLP